jgi:hypothetical protein
MALQCASLPDEPAAHPDGDPVQHDRRDHLVRSGDRLQQSGDARVRRAGESRHGDRKHDMPWSVHRHERRADPQSEDRADDVLALAADVEEPAAESDGDREPAEDECCGQQQRLLQIRRRK